MEKNKTAKYFKYAVGEIALVVIGILIALQINTWNENKKANVKFNKLMVNIFNDLEGDLILAQGIISILDRKDTLATNVINGKYAAADYRKNPALISLIFNFPDFNVTNMGYKALMLNTEIIPSEHDPLIAELNSQYITTAKSIEFYLLSTSKNVNNSHTRYKLNFPWYSQNDAVSIEKKIQHYVNNPIYKNEVKSYQLDALKDYKFFIKKFYNDGIPLYQTLKKMIKDNNPVPSFFPKNADNYDTVKHDYMGKYVTKSGVSILIKENNGFLFLDIEGTSILLSLLSKDKFKEHSTGTTITFKRDESNKVISFSDGIYTVNKVEIND